MSRGRVVLAFSTICFGCAAPPRNEPIAPAAASAVGETAPPPRAAAEPRSRASRRLPIEFVPVAPAAAPDSPPHLEVQAPVSGRRVDLAQAETYQVRLKATSWSEGLSLVMLLDDYPPRVFRDPQKPVALAQLWPAHREIEPGLHRLFAAVQLPDGTTLEREPTGGRASFAYLPFWVGPDDEALEADAMREATGPAVILLAPRGTFNGNTAADQVLLDYQVLGTAPDAAFKVRVEVVVDRETYTAELGPSEVRRIAGLPSGDHLVRIALLGSDGQPSNARYAAASRVITVNRDAPVE